VELILTKVGFGVPGISCDIKERFESNGVFHIKTRFYLRCCRARMMMGRIISIKYSRNFRDRLALWLNIGIEKIEGGGNTLWKESLPFQNQTGHRHQKSRGEPIALSEIYLNKGHGNFSILSVRKAFWPCSALHLETIDQFLTGQV
jgi:hypothetical protein